MNAQPTPMTLQEAFNKAVAHEQEGRIEDAERLLSLILATVPEQPDALHQLGVLAARRKDFVKAAKLIERALVQGERAGIFHRNICEIYRRLGRLEEAVAVLRSAFVDLWKDKQFLADYTKVIQTEPILVMGSDGQAILSQLGNVRREVKEFLIDYIGKLTR